MNLNLGCGPDVRPGFMNIDANIFVKPDLVMDFSQASLLDSFEAASVEFILARDIIEHLWRGDALELLKDCFTLLKAGGKIEFVLPNFEAIITKSGLLPEKMIEYVFGAQNPKRGPQWYGHKYGYTKKSFIGILISVGFRDVTFEDGDTNMVIKATK